MPMSLVAQAEHRVLEGAIQELKTTYRAKLQEAEKRCGESVCSI